MDQQSIIFSSLQTKCLTYQKINIDNYKSLKLNLFLSDFVLRGILISFIYGLTFSNNRITVDFFKSFKYLFQLIHKYYSSSPYNQIRLCSNLKLQFFLNSKEFSGIDIIFYIQHTAFQTGMIQFLDRLSSTNLLTGKKASWIGLLGTLIIVGLCLAIYLPATLSYFKGNYYQSQYSTYKNHTGQIYTKEDIKMAIVIKNKVTGQVQDHKKILSLLDFKIRGWTIDAAYYEPLVQCDNNYFVGDINGAVLEDCLMVPNKILMDVAYDGYYWAELRISISTPNQNIPFPQFTTPLTLAQLYYNQLTNNSYIQFYFTSKVVTPSNQAKFQVHKIYTSQFMYSPTNLWASVAIYQGYRLTMLDDSIMPWRNNRNISTLNWNGNQQYVLSNSNMYGVNFDDTQEVAVRYYKKLDWLLGIIGGGMFFFFIIFWCFFNPINRWLQRIQLPSKLFLRRTNFQNAITEHDLAPLKVSPGFLIRNLWPFCKDKKTLKIVATSQSQNDIVLLLKKLKVATRNLEKKELITQFKTKFIAFPGDDVNALNRYFKGNFDDELSSIQLQSLSSSKSSKSASESCNKKEIKPDESMEQIRQFQQTGGVFLLEEEQNIQKKIQKQIIGQSSKSKRAKKSQKQVQVQKSQSRKQSSESNGQNESDDFEFIGNQQLSNQIQRQANQINGAQGQSKKIPILLIQDNSQPQLQSNILLPHAPGSQAVPPMIIINNNNDGQLIIIPGSQQDPQIMTQIQPTSENGRFIPAQQQKAVRQPLPQVDNNIFNQEPIGNQEQPPAVKQQQQQQIIFEQTKELDQKFNLNSEQFLVLRQNRELQQILENNPTYWSLKQKKPSHYQELMELNNYDQYQGHYQAKKIKCRALVADKIASFFKWLDVFWVRVNFIQNESGSVCGIFLTLSIIALSVITFALTIYNMSSFQYQIDKELVQPNQISFSGNTSDNLNIVVCTSDYYLFSGSSQVFSLNFFVNVSGKVTQIAPDPMPYEDNTFNSYGNYFWYKGNNDNCFKMPPNIPIVLNSTSYFGYTVSLYCPGTTASCTASRSNFVTQAETTYIYTYLPANTIDFNSTTLVSKVSDKISTTFNQIAFTINTLVEETIFAEIVQLRDNSGNQFLGSTSRLNESNINVGLDTARQYIKASNASAPAYSFSVRASQIKTIYTLSQRKISFIIGIIGGVFVFWYAIIGSLGFLYNKFHFNMFVAKQLYEQEGHDDFVLNKIAATLKIPGFLLPSCCEIKDDIERMKGVNTKIEKSLNHVSLIKYVDNVYRLSSSFFNNIYLKQLSLLHFKEKIDQATRLVEIVKVKQNEQQQFVSALDEDSEADKDKSALLGQIANETKMSMGNFDQIYNKEVEQAAKQAPVQIQKYNQNIIEDSQPCCSSIPDAFDIFYEPASFTFKQSRKIQSCFGGLLTLVVIGLVLIVVIRPLLLYFTSAGRTVSYQTSIDDSISSNGIIFTSGTNFKLGITGYNVTTMMPSNITSTLNNTVGISILSIITNKTNGVVTTNQTKIDLIPCPLNYLNSWLSPIAIPPADNFQYAYCVPDGAILEISGVPTDQIHKHFKLSIYDKTNTTNGYKNINNLLTKFFFQIHYSSPEQNYVDQSMKYFVWSTFFDLPGKTHLTLAIERNMTLSKVNVSYDGDSSQWQKQPLTQIGYSYDEFITQRMNYGYYMVSDNNLWYNVSFSFNKRMISYHVTTPKFYEVWGLVGGVIAFFFFIANCLGTSFNKYKMRYLIGRELYNFDKVKDNNLKLKKRKADKEIFQEINNYGQGKILMAYFLSFIGRLTNDFNFNDTLRRITFIQNKVSKDLDLLEFYKDLYIARESINKQLQPKHHIFRRIKPTDLYLKHIYNPSPIQYNFAPLLKKAKQNNLSSFQQMIIFKAKEKRVNIREVFDGKFLAKTFGLEDDNRSAHLHNFQDTIGSFNSSSAGVSAGEPSLTYD